MHEMGKTMSDERDEVTRLVKKEIVLLMGWGAAIAGMTYRCDSGSMQRTCTSPSEMRKSYLEDEGDLNLKRIHWIFSELPWTTHRDILVQRKSHMDLVVKKVEDHMHITWAPMVEGRGPKRKNCIEHIYFRVLNEKRATIIRGAKRTPYVRTPKSFAQANHDPNYRKGKTLFCWRSRTDGEHSVSKEII